MFFFVNSDSFLYKAYIMNFSQFIDISSQTMQDGFQKAQGFWQGVDEGSPVFTRTTIGLVGLAAIFSTIQAVRNRNIGVLKLLSAPVKLLTYPCRPIMRNKTAIFALSVCVAVVASGVFFAQEYPKMIKLREQLTNFTWAGFTAVDSGGSIGSLVISPKGVNASQQCILGYSEHLFIPNPLKIGSLSDQRDICYKVDQFFNNVTSMGLNSFANYGYYISFTKNSESNTVTYLYRLCYQDPLVRAREASISSLSFMANKVNETLSSLLQ